jgi:hypothetical protein
MKDFIVVTLLLINLIGYCQDNTSLNNITISEIYLPKDDGTCTTLELSNTMGNYNYKFEDQEIYILYFYKNNTFYDSPYSTFHDYFRLFEQYNSGIINEMPRIAPLQNTRFNIINNYKFVDAFIFLADEFINKQLTRIVYLMTNNYYIRIRITINLYNDMEREKLFEKIYEEVPQYFNLVSYESLFNGREIIIWDKDGVIRFENDLLTGQNKSTIANTWFLETEKFLNNIQFK